MSKSYRPYLRWLTKELKDFLNPDEIDHLVQCAYRDETIDGENRKLIVQSVILAENFGCAEVGLFEDYSTYTEMPLLIFLHAFAERITQHQAYDHNNPIWWVALMGRHLIRFAPSTKVYNATDPFFGPFDKTSDPLWTRSDRWCHENDHRSLYETGEYNV